MNKFAAIDFETANNSRDSACSIGVVVVEDGIIVEHFHELIRPPTRHFLFTHIHGLTWNDVKDAPKFDEVWSSIKSELTGINFLAAHNAPFDQGVLLSCCSTYGIRRPSYPFVCTVGLARSHWNIYPTKLPNVCDRLGIDLNHHDAGSDAEACARIVIAAQEDGWRYRKT